MKKIFLFIVLSFTILVCSSCSKSTYQTKSQKTVIETPDALIKNNTEFELQSFLKTTGATTDDLKKYVAVDTGCPVEKIVIKEKFEQLGDGLYLLEVCGKELKYKRTGSVFYKDGEDPIKSK